MTLIEEEQQQKTILSTSRVCRLFDIYTILFAQLEAHFRLYASDN